MEIGNVIYFLNPLILIYDMAVYFSILSKFSKVIIGKPQIFLQKMKIELKILKLYLFRKTLSHMMLYDNTSLSGKL